MPAIEGIPIAITNYWDSHPDSIWLYNPNFPLAIVAAVLYAIPLFTLLYLTVFRYKSYYFIVVVTGAWMEVVGYAMRAVSIKNYTLIPTYAASATLIVVAPLFIGAGSYLLITRLCLRVLRPLPNAQLRKIFFMPVHRLTLIFVLCDVLTLLVQAGGSAIAASNNWEGGSVKIGENILIAGLSLQLCTFSFFLIIVWCFHNIVEKEGVREGAGDGWRKVLWAVYVSCSMIIIRCIYRLVEFALGIFGYPFTHEWIFYTLEAIPMLLAVSIFCVWHPGAYFGAGGRRGGKSPVGDDGIPL